MESGAKGCEVIVSGKLRAQRAKAMKFKDGYMISSGNPVNDYIDGAVRHVMLRQGVLGIKVGTATSRSASLGYRTDLCHLVTRQEGAGGVLSCAPATAQRLPLELALLHRLLLPADETRSLVILLYR